MNTDALKQLQECCAKRNESFEIRPDGLVTLKGQFADLTMSPDAMYAHLGLAANDNQPQGVALNEPGYESLAQVLRRAFDQASNGKGHDRHANQLPFHKQPMQVIAGQVGPGFLTGQAIKKIQESQRLPEGRDTHELLGAINYLAGVVIFLESQRHAANDAMVQA
jgi:hypothetical protein